jgi:hypothetical protein
MAKIPTDTSSAPKRRGRPAKSGGALSKAEVQRAYRARLKTSGKVLKWVDVSCDAGERNAPLAEQRDDLDRVLARLEVLQQDVARLKVRVGELEAEVERSKDEAKETSRLRQRLQTQRQQNKSQMLEVKIQK